MNSKNNAYILPLILIAVDYGAIICAEYLSYILRNFIIQDGARLLISDTNLFVVFPAIFLLFTSVKHLYKRRAPFVQIIENLFTVSTHGSIAIIMLLYLDQLATMTSRLFLGLLWVSVFFSLVFFRFLVKKVVTRFDIFQLPILIIGAGKTAELFLEGLNREDNLGYKVIGFLEDKEIQLESLNKYPVLGKFEDVEKVIKDTGVQHVIIAAPGLDPEALSSLLYRVQRLVKSVGFIPNYIGVPMGGIEVETLFNEKLMLLKVKNNLAKPFNVFVKTLFDYTLTIVGTVAISPLLLFIAYKIKSADGGPAIYDGLRVGKNSKTFPCYKFRSMCVNADKILGAFLDSHPAEAEEFRIYKKLKKDPRVTKVGQKLRSTSLDELPQIFNVLRGEMSLVGPRPYIPSEIQELGEAADTILSVKPGITGLWQVSGRNECEFQERVLMDIWYVHNWSVWMDPVILWRTIKVVLTGHGAY